MITERQALTTPPPLDAARCALFLDLDGTLAPIEARPEVVAPEARRTKILIGAVEALKGRLAVISGRALADVDRILARTVEPVAAVHGLVRRLTPGDLQHEPGHPALPAAAKALRAFANQHPGLLAEDKELSVALHYRQAPEMEEPAKALARDLAREHGLELQPGNMVMELRSPGPDKGDAVRAFMRQAPFAGAVPVFVGDDLTDEAGFAAATALGGYGVVVGDRVSEQARYRLADVRAVLDWLEALAR